MSSESVNEGLVVASERKQSEGIDFDTSSNHHDRAEEVVKKEQSSEWPSSEQSIKSGKDDLTLAQLSKAAPRSHSSSYTGNRKKKPKEMHDDFCCPIKEGEEDGDEAIWFQIKAWASYDILQVTPTKKGYANSQGGESLLLHTKLVEGDVLIFQLVETNKFKVYVVRANDLTEVDGALGLLNLDAHIKQNDAGKDDADNSEIAPNNKKRKRLKSLPLAVIKKKKKIGLPKSVAKSIQSAKQFENDCEEVHLEVPAGPRLSGSAVRFRDVKSFTDFNILVDGLCIDSELPEHIRVKYYARAAALLQQNTLIHARLFRGLNSKLVAGIVCETVNIADAIRACKLTTSRDEYLIWEKTLKSFELMGMSDAKSGKGRAEDEIRDLEAKLVELKQASEKFGRNITYLLSSPEFGLLVRANDLTEVDGALGLLNLDAHIKQNDAGKDDADNSEIPPNNKKRKRLKSLPLAVHLEVPAGPRLSGSAVRFRDVKSFTDFNILVDGLCIDSELPEHIRPDAIRACKLTTSRDEYLIWEKTLKSFELMGMSVGFLRARLRHLLILAFESDDARDARRYLDAKSGKGRAEDEIRDLEAKLVELKQASEKFGADIESLKSKAESFEHKFQEEIDAPW
ncbi:hypothetical protein Acr_27g0004950 [Actinidia rufa]|uniref:Uncharacterized protein n=1 Tax=Actinidia rufa TaxID=165716 RepID=A0A7J0H6N3_9ERIC|nr:hypothetical protein Acr_27g0004950 [Actinidia rufa]